MGGTDEKDNLVELTIDEHAEAHRKLYEEHGHWQDLLAWKGLTKLVDSDECVRIAIIEGAKMGAAITNAKRWHNHVKKERKYPLGVDGRKVRTKKNWYHNGNEEGQFELGNAPEGWERGRLKGVYGGSKGNQYTKRVSGAKF